MGFRGSASGHAGEGGGRIVLDGAWQLSFGKQALPSDKMDAPEIPEGFTSIPATVPGNVELDLIRAGLLPEDLDRGDNAYRVLPYETHQWWYRRTFEIADLRRLPSPILVFDGVDTVATVWLNGKKLARVDNMLIPHELDVEGALRTGANELVVAIDSPVLEALRHEIDAGAWAMENNWESLHVRKPPHSYGWDIMPRMLSAGLWRGVHIESRSPYRFKSVYLATLRTDAAAGTAELLARWSIAAPEWSTESRHLTLTVSDPTTGQRVYERSLDILGNDGEFRAKLENVGLWYPRGYGSPALYTIELVLRNGSGDVYAEWRRPFGLRTARLVRTDVLDAEGNGEFAFFINGVRVFVKGSNWVPVDALHSRDAGRLSSTLDLAADLNLNMIRCWGGNVYEDTPFFEFCDREGIMVWQDFALACALYPQTEAFHAKMRHEAEIIVPRLRNHPSLVLWSGNNENDQLYPRGKPGTDPNQDDLISRKVLPEVCRRLDPYRDYLPSSPYYSPAAWQRGADLHKSVPEDHLWGPRGDFKGEFYAGSTAIFASEIGYHGCPARSSLERMMRPENLWPWQGNEDWLTHAVRPQPGSTEYNYRIALMARQVEILFGKVPDDLDDFIIASQMSQAEALKFFIEMFRLRKGRRSGILWWNIRDGWPQISDAVVDYYGARKLAYDVARRLQADTLVMLGEPVDGHQDVVAVNDTLTPVVTDVTVEAAGEVLLKVTGAELPANSRTLLGRLPAPAGFTVIGMKWEAGGASAGNHYIAGPRPFALDRLKAAYRSILGDDAVNRQVESR